jgi:hypothetical protein
MIPVGVAIGPILGFPIMPRGPAAWFGSVVALTLSCVPVAYAQPGPCPGPKVQPHPFNFDTNSRTVQVDPAENGGFSLGVISCVQNNDPADPLYVRWLIPGPDGWALQGFHLESGARLRNPGQVLQLDGCLQYGNRGDLTKALFLSIDGDQSKITDENATGCRSAAAAIGSAKTGVIEKIRTFIQNFFPSDAKNAAKTMLQFKGAVGIRPMGTDGYESFMEYSIAKLNPDSDGSVEGMMFRPEFQGNVESLLPDFKSSNPKDANLLIKKEGSLSFVVKGVRNPSLSYGTYAIYDRSGQRVAGISLPLIISGK